MKSHRKTVWAVLLGALLGAAAQGLSAQQFPSKPVRLIQPNGPGVSTDLMIRSMATKLSERLGTTVLTENKPGGNFVVGTQYVLQQPHDGHTVLVSFAALTILPYTKKDLPYDLLKDLVPVTRFGRIPLMVAVTPSLPAKNLTELVSYSKANPGQLNFRVNAYASSSHLGGEMLKQATGLDMVAVPYQQASSASNADLMSGRVQVGVGAVGNWVELIKAGKLRAIAALSPVRSTFLPELATVAELTGSTEVDADSWIGLMVPTGSPKAAIERLYKEVAQVLQLPELQEQLTRQGIVLVNEGPDQFRKKIEADLRRWERVIKQAGLKFD